MLLSIQNAIKEHQAVIEQLEPFIPELQILATKMIATINAGGKIFWMGNGGSAADAQHLAAELIGRFTRERRAIPSLSLSTDSSVLTSLGNDYDYSIVFSRQLEALCSNKDLVIGISTSGNSENVLKGIKTAKQIGAYTVGLTGNAGGRLAGLPHQCLIVPSKNTARIQEAHILMGHILCDCLEEAIHQEAQHASVANAE